VAIGTLRRALGDFGQVPREVVHACGGAVPPTLSLASAAGTRPKAPEWRAVGEPGHIRMRFCRSIPLNRCFKARYGITPGRFQALVEREEQAVCRQRYP
jgi:hypothetical protein